MSGMPRWPGQGWYERHDGRAPTIAIIEKPAETYDQYHERKKREERDGKPRKVPFGFGRVLLEEESDGPND